MKTRNRKELEQEHKNQKFIKIGWSCAHACGTPFCKKPQNFERPTWISFHSGIRLTFMTKEGVSNTRGVCYNSSRWDRGLQDGEELYQGIQAWNNVDGTPLAVVMSVFMLS